MRRVSPVLLLAVTACAAGGGAWPSLARRPVEGPRPPLTAPRRCAVATGEASCAPGGGESVTAAGTPASPAPAVAAPPVAIDDISARLAVIDRDLGDTAARLATQKTATAAAVAAARGRAQTTPEWAKAELERTALDRIGNQIGDVRERLDGVAGTLAAASAGGADVSAPLLATGRLIARTTALTADYEAAAAAR